MGPARIAVLVAGAHLLAGAAAAELRHEPVGCLVADRFPRLEATFAPLESLARARVRFRPEGGAHWYSVPMTREGTVLAAVLPKPKESLKSVEYYVEVIDTATEVSRTADHVARVTAGPAACQDAKVASSVASATVAIEVPAGAPAVPAGFSSSGLSAAGAAAVAGGVAVGAAAAAGGGGVSAAVLIGAGAAVAAAGTAVAVTAGGGDDIVDTGGDPDSRPIRIAVSVTSPAFQLPFPFTVQFEGQSAASQAGEGVELQATVTPGTHEMTVTPARGGHVNVGFRVGLDSGIGGVEVGSPELSAPVILHTPPCGYTVNTPGPFTVRYRVSASATGTCASGGGGGN